MVIKVDSQELDADFVWQRQHQLMTELERTSFYFTLPGSDLSLGFRLYYLFLAHFILSCKT